MGTLIWSQLFSPPRTDQASPKLTEKDLKQCVDTRLNGEYPPSAAVKRSCYPFHREMEHMWAAAKKQLQSPLVSTASKLKQENMPEVLQYCVDGGLRVLAYEYTPNGSLRDIIHGETRGETLLIGSKPTSYHYKMALTIELHLAIHQLEWPSGRPIPNFMLIGLKARDS
ncbi:hypothetical protein LguiA_002444 [Lonicera macranthoides]